MTRRCVSPYRSLPPWRTRWHTWWTEWDVDWRVVIHKHSPQTRYLCWGSLVCERWTLHIVGRELPLTIRLFRRKKELYHSGNHSVSFKLCQKEKKVHVFDSVYTSSSLTACFSCARRPTEHDRCFYVMSTTALSVSTISNSILCMRDQRQRGVTDIANGHPTGKCQKEDSNPTYGILGPVFQITTDPELKALKNSYL